MGGPETRLGFLVLLLIVWFSGTPGGEFRRGTCGAWGAGKLGELRRKRVVAARGFAKLLARWRRGPLLFPFPWPPYSSAALLGRTRCLG